MRKDWTVAVVLLVALVLGGCAGLNPTLTGPALFKTLERHDAYVEADPALKSTGNAAEDHKREGRKKAFLQTSDFLRQTWNRAGYNPEE